MEPWTVVPGDEDQDGRECTSFIKSFPRPVLKPYSHYSAEMQLKFARCTNLEGNTDPILHHSVDSAMFIHYALAQKLAHCLRRRCASNHSESRCDVSIGAYFKLSIVNCVTTQGSG